MPTRFADPAEFSPIDLFDVPVRYPRPSRLDEPLIWAIPTVREAADLLGLRTVGDLLHHLPRDSGEGRTIEELVEDEVATIVVEVRRITARPVRRRGMKPLVQAMVVDGTGALEATFFNQPWLERQYVPGTRLVLAGKYQGGNRFRVNSHAITDELVATGAAVAQYPATKGITSTQILAAVQA
ncbi:MAG: ATP-dependent helicase RecG, partial [Solirubrobacterales bacterium]|nr:ATP-dependent helicase RecG [Solirubrobacterales bacterium]